MNLIDFRRSEPHGLASTEVAITAAGGQSARVPVLLQYLEIARRRKWVIIGFVIGAFLLGLLASLLMTPKYTASATIEIQREARNFTNVSGVEPQQTSPVDNEFYQTQYGLLRARSLADAVATDLKVVDSADFFQTYKSRYADKWFNNGRLIPGASTRERRTREAGQLLLNRITIDPARLSRLVEISFASPDPTFSKRVVDSWADNFIDLTLKRRFDTTAYARRFLEQRLNQLRSRLDQSQRQAVDYAAQQSIVSIPASTPATEDGGITGERPVLADDLAILNRELARATADRVVAQSRLSANGGAAREALENQGISQIRARRAELAAEYAKMLEQFEPGYPPARALRSQIDRLDQSLATEETRVRRSIDDTYRASLAREVALRNQVNQLKAGVLDLRRRSIQYDMLQRDVDTSRQLYDALLQRYKEIGVAGGVGVNNISIVDYAELPQKPSSPKLFLNLLLALVVGLVAGAVAAFVMEQIDQAISDPDDVENQLGFPLLGTLPKLGDGTPYEALEDRRSELTEAYFSLLTSLSFSTDHGAPRSLAVTSTSPAEGKSTTTYAIAHSLARSKKKVVLIDADMRSPSIHDLLSLDNKRGLSNFLAGDNDTQKLIQTTARDGLFVVAAGPPPPSPSELLAGDRLEQLIAALLREFDHVLIDAPPVVGLADAPLIASKVEGTVFVVESRSTHRNAVRVSLNRLAAANATIIGVALTKFEAKHGITNYGYGYGYGYGNPSRTES